MKKRLGIYLHIPFCVKKCAYCDFLSFAPKKGDEETYCAALAQETALYGQKMRGYLVDSVFLGGGTPTLLSGARIAALLHTLRAHFSLATDCEITIEANPGTVCAQKAGILARSGVNRVSFGLQAAQDRHLSALGRIHSAAQLREGAAFFRREGVCNISVDLMYGLPGQTTGEFLESIEFALDCGARHISAYSLTPEEGTPLFQALEAGETALPEEDLEREMFCAGETALEKQGFFRYEVSNYAQEGYACRHNLKYWTGAEYLGLGLGAHSFLRNSGCKRFANTRDLREYVQILSALRLPVVQEQALSKKEEIFETVMLGLRLKRGISLDGFFEKFGEDFLRRFSGAVEKNMKNGLLQLGGGCIFLTARGMEIMNGVLLDFMEENDAAQTG